MFKAGGKFYIYLWSCNDCEIPPPKELDVIIQIMDKERVKAV